MGKPQNGCEINYLSPDRFLWRNVCVMILYASPPSGPGGSWYLYVYFISQSPLRRDVIWHFEARLNNKYELQLIVATINNTYSIIPNATAFTCYFSTLLLKRPIIHNNQLQ